VAPAFSKFSCARAVLIAKPPVLLRHVLARHMRFQPMASRFPLALSCERLWDVLYILLTVHLLTVLPIVSAGVTTLGLHMSQSPVDPIPLPALADAFSALLHHAPIRTRIWSDTPTKPSSQQYQAAGRGDGSIYGRLAIGKSNHCSQLTAPRHRDVS
jgi:hypothetical protein